MAFGDPGDLPLAGDWDGDGRDGVAVVKGTSRFLLNRLESSAAADAVVTYGDPGDVPLAGDWDRDGIDTAGLRRGIWFVVVNEPATTLRVDAQFAFGNATLVRSDREPGLDVTPAHSGLDHPWDVAFAPDGTAVLTERPGRLSAILPDGTFRPLAADLSDLFVAGETGLLGVAVDPAFTSNRRIYTCQGALGPSIQVVAWVVDAGWTRADRVASPVVGGLPSISGRHGGCRLLVGPDGQLWIGTGDAAVGSTPQDLTSLGGKVLRVDPATGGGSAGNPFAASPDPATRRIWSYGHRNVQGLAVRPGTG